MKIETVGEQLVISGLDRLSATNAGWFKEITCLKLNDAHRGVEVDLGQAEFIDSEGLGALIAIKKRLADRRGQLRLLRPRPLVDGMLKLLHMDRVFDIVNN